MRAFWHDGISFFVFIQKWQEDFVTGLVIIKKLLSSAWEKLSTYGVVKQPERKYTFPPLRILWSLGFM